MRVPVRVRVRVRVSVCVRVRVRSEMHACVVVRSVMWCACVVCVGQWVGVPHFHFCLEFGIRLFHINNPKNHE